MLKGLGNFTYDKFDSGTIVNGDCLDVMPLMADKSVDLILTDLPFATTSASWDVMIDLDLLWQQYMRIIKHKGAIVLFADGIFTGQLMMSNPKWFKYKLIWDKKHTSGFLNAKIMPLRRHEDILVFGKGKITYNPQMEVRGKPRQKGNTGGNGDGNSTYGSHKGYSVVNNEYYPTSILEFSNANQKDKVHPTQKSLPLIEYLIKTFSNEGEIVLDSTMGSGTTCLAAARTGREFVGIELNKEYYEIAKERINEHYASPNLWQQKKDDEV